MSDDAMAILVAKLDRMERKLDELHDREADRMLNMRQAADEMGLSATYFYSKPWMIPGNGFRGNVHSLRDWRQAFADGEPQRRAAFDEIPVDLRRGA